MKFITFINESEKIYYHGTPSGDLRGGKAGLHVGTYKAAKEALEARIGIPAEGDWDGTREYGKTLLAGKKRLKEIDPKGYNQTGYNCGKVPEENYFASDRHDDKADYSDGTFVCPTCKPNIIKVKIIGPMTNTPNNPRTDDNANLSMIRDKKRNKAIKGYYYKNIGEDEGSISAVVPDQSFIQVIS